MSKGGLIQGRQTEQKLFHRSAADAAGELPLGANSATAKETGARPGLAGFGVVGRSSRTKNDKPSMREIREANAVRTSEDKAAWLGQPNSRCGEETPNGRQQAEDEAEAG